MLPFRLPAYTLNLNLLERVWRFFKQQSACVIGRGLIERN
jgi:hypothetical protein